MCTRHVAQILLTMVLLCILVSCEAPQSRGILTTSADGQIAILDRDSGNIQLVAPVSAEGQNILFPMWSPQGDAILYQAWDGSKASLWIMERDGQNLRFVASSMPNSTVLSGKWSFDGRYVAYQTGMNQRDPTTWRLTVLDLTKLTATEIITGAWGYAWSSSDLENLIAICRWAQEDSGLYVFGVDGSQRYTLTITGTQHLSPSLLCDYSMTWRPHSWQIAFTCEPANEASFTEICTVDPRTGEVQVLTHGQSSYSYRRASTPVWSPDGQALLFLADYKTPEGEVQNALFVLDVTTGEEHELASGLAGVTPAWSPDGSEIAFVAPGEGEEGQGTQVLVIDLQTGRITQLTHDNTVRISLSW